MSFVSKLRQVRKRQGWIIIGGFLGSIFLFLIVAGYVFHWTGTGFSNKSLWDWMQLLLIPFALAVVAIWFNRVERRNEQAIASDNQQAGALQAYLGTMSDLLLKEGLRQSEADAEVRYIARARTLTILRQLDGSRKGSLLQFLYESGLIHRGKSIISLEGADLRNAELTNLALRGIDLRGANLDSADLSMTDLNGADLSETVLYGASLVMAGLVDTNLSEATLVEANLRFAQLSRANLTQVNLSSADFFGASFDDAILTHAKFTSLIVKELLTEEQCQQINLTVKVKSKIYKVQLEPTDFVK